MEPFFSVIIPLFNAEPYIEETLRSLASQTINNFEVIIIDDGSTDRSVELAETTKKKLGLAGNIIIRPSNIEKGVSSCRNLGVKNAKGNWICFLDSDDLFHPQKLEIVLSSINLDEKTKVIHHLPINFNDGESFDFMSIKNSEQQPQTSDITHKLIQKNFITTSTVIVKKEVFDLTAGFDTSLHGVEDYFMWLSISKHSQWSYLNLPLTAYRIRTDSLMGARRLKYYVEQNSNLIKKMQHVSFFSIEEIKAVRKYFMDDVMSYYASISINKYGWADFLNGLIHLGKKGYPVVSFFLLQKHLKFTILLQLSKLNFYRNKQI